MLIGEKYKIESDSLNVTLYEKRKAKGKSTTWRAIAFFSNPKNALQHLVNLEVMETEMKDLTAVVKKQDELYALINTLKGLPERLQSSSGVAKGLV